MAPNPIGPCATECVLKESHGRVLQKQDDHDKRLESQVMDIRELYRKNDEVREELMSRLPKWALMLGGAMLMGLGSFFGMWVQGQRDMDKVVAAQYEVKGMVDDLRGIVVVAVRGGKGETGPAGPAGPAGAAGAKQ